MLKINMYKWTFLVAIILIISSVPLTQQIIASGHPHSVKGALYINDEIASEGIEIKLEFPEETETTVTYEYNLYGDSTNYNFGFWDHEGKTGYFYIIYQGNEYEPEDNKSILIEEEVTGYFIDLHVVTPVNHPPNAPENPVPANNSENVDINPYLSVDVSDPDDDPMDVSFYDASDDSLIDTDHNVNSGDTATVQWTGLDYNTEYQWYAFANDSEYETKSETWNFTTSEYVNHPPAKPINPSPEDGAEDIDINPDLSVDVNDPDDDPMNVSFHDASDNSIIGTDYNVPSGSTATIQWTGLSLNTTYTWYAIANDSEYESKSDTWSFTTKDEGNIPPTVKIITPERGVYFRNKKILRRFIRLTLIIGKITIEANATDEDSGIEKVEFYINGKLKGNDTTEPYQYNWTRDRLRLFHIFIIKVKAYDNDGAFTVKRRIVRKFL